MRKYLSDLDLPDIYTHVINIVYSEQNLTEEQKTQMRLNINAATVEDVLAALSTWQGGEY